MRSLFFFKKWGKKARFISFFSAFKRSNKKSGLIFATQMLFLIFSFFLVLWGQQKLKDLAEKSQPPTMERKARILKNSTKNSIFEFFLNFCSGNAL